ncbi:hypothetical protein HK102_008203, partial [Quaeritorhiza haematococci]
MLYEEDLFPVEPTHPQHGNRISGTHGSSSHHAPKRASFQHSSSTRGRDSPVPHYSGSNAAPPVPPLPQFVAPPRRRPSVEQSSEQSHSAVGGGGMPPVSVADHGGGYGGGHGKKNEMSPKSVFGNGSSPRSKRGIPADMGSDYPQDVDITRSDRQGGLVTVVEDEVSESADSSGRLLDAHTRQRSNGSVELQDDNVFNDGSPFSKKSVNEGSNLQPHEEGVVTRNIPIAKGVTTSISHNVVAFEAQQQQQHQHTRENPSKPTTPTPPLSATPEQPSNSNDA